MGRPYRYCCFAGCNRNNYHNVSFKRLTRIPDEEPSPTDTIKWHKLYILKKRERREQLERCDLSREDNRASLRFCSDHEYEIIQIYHTLQHNGKGGKVGDGCNSAKTLYSFFNIKYKAKLNISQ